MDYIITSTILFLYICVCVLQFEAWQLLQTYNYVNLRAFNISFIHVSGLDSNSNYLLLAKLIKYNISVHHGLWHSWVKPTVRYLNFTTLYFAFIYDNIIYSNDPNQLKVQKLN